MEEKKAFVTDNAEVEHRVLEATGHLGLTPTESPFCPFPVTNRLLLRLMAALSTPVGTNCCTISGETGG